MAKIISQVTLFDYNEIEILGDLERLQLAVEGIDDEELMCKLEKKRGKKGRDDYPVRVMWNLILAMLVFGHTTVASFRRECSRNSQLRKICGLDDFSNKKHLVPPQRVFTGFFKRLQSEKVLLKKIFSLQVEQISIWIPEFGASLAGEGKYIDSYAKRPSKKENVKAGNRRETDAAYSIKEYHYIDKDGKMKSKKETHYGFKAHIICDVNTELPVDYRVTAANVDEKKPMTEMIKAFSEEQKNRAKVFLLDRGYDSIDMIRTIKDASMKPIIDIRNCWKDGEETKQYKNTDIVYNYKGDVYIFDEKGKQHKMHYEGYDEQKNCLRYSYNGKIHKIYIRYDERVFLPIARDSMKFKRIYKGRTSVERLNGRLDRDFLFEDHCIRGLEKMEMMVSLSMIVMNGMALGKLQRGIKTNLAATKKVA